jgi:glycosyltransferase involved in cell wall biosynthesis
MFWAEKVTAIPALLTRHKVLFNEHGLGLWKKWYHKTIMRLISTIAKKVACTCEKNCIIRKKNHEVTSRKLTCLYNSYDENIVVPINKKNFDYRTIGYVGRFHKVKRLDTFFQLHQRIQTDIPVKMLLVGEGEEMGNVKSNIQANNLEDIFVLPGYQKETDSFYQQMSIFVLPSRIEALSIALIESQAYGIPGIAFDVGGNDEIIIDGVTGFIVEDGRTDIMADKIKTLLTNIDLWKKMSKQAQKLASEKFSGRMRINTIQKLYTEILNEPKT